LLAHLGMSDGRGLHRHGGGVTQLRKCASIYDSRIIHRLDVRPLTTNIGAEIFGIDLNDELDEATFADLYATFLEYQVVFLPGQFLDPESLRAIAARFGTIDVNPAAPTAAGYDDVVELNALDGIAPDIWHYDGSFSAVPAGKVLLSMVMCPPVGGDTSWISGTAALAGLSAPMRDLLEGLHVVHDGAWIGLDDLRAEQPAVRVHSETGRSSLFVDWFYALRVVELSKAESDNLLAFLALHITDPAFACRYRWTPGAVAIWDNRCTLHRVVTDFDGPRIVHRVSVAGEPPSGAPTRWPRFEPRNTSAGMRDRIGLGPVREV
jgi:taurine dioxygenase